MKKYKIKETGEVLMARSPAILVELLNRTARLSSPTPEQYMLEYAKRSVIYRDTDIRATDFESFVEDLVKVGDLEEL